MFHVNAQSTFVLGSLNTFLKFLLLSMRFNFYAFCLLVSERCQNWWIKTSLLSQVASLSAKKSFQSCRNTAHLLSAPLIKTRMLTRLNWSQPNGIYVRSVGQLAAPDLNNLPKMPQWRDPILAAWPGCSWPGCMELLSPGVNRLSPAGLN